MSYSTATVRVDPEGDIRLTRQFLPSALCTGCDVGR